MARDPSGRELLLFNAPGEQKENWELEGAPWAAVSQLHVTESPSGQFAWKLNILLYN